MTASQPSHPLTHIRTSGHGAGRHGRRYLAFSQFGGCERPQQVELDAVRVGHDHPANVSLTDAHPAGAECFQPGDLGDLITGPQVQMQPVLDDLAFGNFQEERVRGNAILGAPGGRLEDYPVVRLEGAPPAERRLPERRDLRRISGVDTQALNAYVHTETVVGRGVPCRIVLPLVRRPESTSASAAMS